jgi:hypothetical protein
MITRSVRPALAALAILLGELSPLAAAQNPLQPALGTLGWLPPPAGDVRLADQLLHQDEVGGALQELQMIDGAPGGGFVAAWRDLRDGLLGIYVARFDENLALREPERPMYAPHTARRIDPCVFAYADGGGAIAWTSVHGGGSAPWLRAFGPDGAWQSPVEFLAADPAQTPAELRAGGMDRRRPFVFAIDPEHMGLAWVWQDRVQYSLRNKRGDPLAEVVDIGKGVVEPGLAAAPGVDGTLLVAWRGAKGVRGARGAKAGGRWQEHDLGAGIPRAVRARAEGGWALLVQDGDGAVLRLCDERLRVVREQPVARGVALGLVQVRGLWCVLVDAAPGASSGADERARPDRRGGGPARGRGEGRQGILTGAPPAPFAFLGGSAPSIAHAAQGRGGGAPTAPGQAGAGQAGPGQTGPGQGRGATQPPSGRGGAAQAGASAASAPALHFLSAAGEPVGEVVQPLPPEAVQPAGPRLASDGRRLLFGWTDRRAGDPDAWGRLFEVSESGACAPVVAKRLNTDIGSSDQLHPMVASNGSSAFAAWGDRRFGAGRIHVRAVGAEGLVGPELPLPRPAPKARSTTDEGAPPEARVLPGAADRPHAAVSADGAVLVAWRQTHEGRTALWAQVLGADGAALDEPQLVEESGAGKALSPPFAIAWRAAGAAKSGWAIAWTRGEFGQRDEKDGAFVAKLDARGARVGAPQRASDPGSLAQEATLAQMTDGRVLVAWTSHDGDSRAAGWRLQARWFGAGLERQGAQFGFEASRRGNDWDPSLAPAPDGGFAVAWCSGHPGDLLRDVCVRLHDRDGKPKGPILSPCHLGNEQDFPEVVRLADGSYAVAWEDDLSGLDQTLVRRMQADGQGMHGDDTARLLNELETVFVGDRVAPRIAPLGDGLVAVFGDRRRSLGLDARVKVLGAGFDARR